MTAFIQEAFPTVPVWGGCPSSAFPGTLHWCLVTPTPLLGHELFLYSFGLEWALEDARNELTNDPGVAYFNTYRNRKPSC